MLPRVDQSTQAVSRVDAVTGVASAVEARQQALQRALSHSLGKIVHADVLSKFADGTFLVKVAGIDARMQLPATVQVGRQAALTLVALSPRPTFELAGQGGAQTFAEPTAAAPIKAGAAPQAGLPLAGTTAPTAGLPGGAPLTSLATAAPSAPAARPDIDAAGNNAVRVGSGAHAAALLSKAPLLPTAQLAPLNASTPAPSLSDAGQAISGVLALALRDGAPPAALVGRTPLLAGPPATPAAPAALAAALHDALATSGLFYESHVAEWASGQRPRADLLQEPQMQRAAAPSTETGRSAPALDNVTAQLVNLQLHTQEQARVAWQGQAWPGQDLRWDVAHEESERPQGGGDSEEAAPHWGSDVRLRFALLGEIGARVMLSGQHVHIRIDAPDDAIGALLREHAGALGLSLDAAGTPLASLTFSRTDAA